MFCVIWLFLYQSFFFLVLFAFLHAQYFLMGVCFFTVRLLLMRTWWNFVEYTCGKLLVHHKSEVFVH